MDVARSRSTTYSKRLLEARSDLEEALVGIDEFNQTYTINKLLDCYFSVVLFDVEFKKDFADDTRDADPYQLLALHAALTKKQLDVADLLATVNRNTVNTGVSLVRRLFSENRSFIDVLGVLNQATRLRVDGRKRGGADDGGGDETLPNGLSRFDMSVAGGFDTVIGQDDAVAALRTAVEESAKSGQPLSAILYGPPGTGKTSLALAVGRHYGLQVYTLSVASLGGQFVGEREKNVTEIFEYLEKRSDGGGGGGERPTLLFIDEADSFLSDDGGGGGDQRAAYTRVVVTDLVENFLSAPKKGSGSTANRFRVLVAATNFLDRVSPSIRQRSKTVLIDLPKTLDDTRRLVAYYRKSYRLNMTESREERIARHAFHLGLAPSHVSQTMRRLSSLTLLTMLKRGIVVTQTKFLRKQLARAFAKMALPAYTVSGVALDSRPGQNDNVAYVYDGSSRTTPVVLTPDNDDDDDGVVVPADTVYPMYNGKIENLFAGFQYPSDESRETLGNSVDDAEYHPSSSVTPDERPGVPPPPSPAYVGGGGAERIESTRRERVKLFSKPYPASLGDIRKAKGDDDDDDDRDER